MQFVTINDRLAPIRLLRQVGPITNEELAAFLEREGEFQRREAEAGGRWISVIDIRLFDGASEGQREMMRAWMLASLAALRSTTEGVAFVLTPALDERVRLVSDLLDGASIPTCMSRELDEALDWALQLTYELDVAVDADLVLNGVDAFRPALT